jgi:hypothetical protein
MKRSLLLAAAAMALVIASAATAQLPTLKSQSARVFARGAWVETRRIADPTGRLLTNPLLLAAVGDTAYVYDSGTQELSAILAGGNVQWRVGRAGRGPREFSNPVDLQRAPNGTLHVLDSDVSRITIIDPSGRIAAMHTVEERLHRIVPRPAGWWGVSLARPELFVTLGGDGRVSGERVAAPADIAPRHMLVREPQVAPLPNGGAVVAFVWSSRVLVLGPDGRMVADLDGPESVPFPEVRSYAISEPRNATVQRIDPNAIRGAWQVTANDSMALVLFGGSTRDAGLVVDRFDLRSKRYIDSARLTRPAAALRLTGSTLVVLEVDPAPALVFYEWRRGRSD